jgi:hypothetical protein
VVATEASLELPCADSRVVCAQAHFTPLSRGKKVRGISTKPHSAGQHSRLHLGEILARKPRDDSRVRPAASTPTGKRRKVNKLYVQPGAGGSCNAVADADAVAAAGARPCCWMRSWHSIHRFFAREGWAVQAIDSPPALARPQGVRVALSGGTHGKNIPRGRKKESRGPPLPLIFRNSEIRLYGAYRQCRRQPTPVEVHLARSVRIHGIDSWNDAPFLKLLF